MKYLLIASFLLLSACDYSAKERGESGDWFCKFYNSCTKKHTPTCDFYGNCKKPKPLECSFWGNCNKPKDNNCSFYGNCKKPTTQNNCSFYGTCDGDGD